MTTEFRKTSIVFYIDLVMISVYIYETLLLTALVLYLVNYFRGKSANRAIAERWVDCNRELFDKQFEVVGNHDVGGTQ